MLPNILSLIMEMAPSSAELIQRMEASRFKDRDVIIMLLALNLEQAKVLEEVSQCVSDIRSEQVRIKGR